MIVVPAGDKTALVGQYVGSKCKCIFEEGTFQALAVLNDDNEFVAGVVVSEYSGVDCRISCATETSTAWRPHVIRAVFDYVFNQLGCVRCTAVTLKRNVRARKFMEGLGFVLEGRLRLGYDGVKDALIYGYLASDCRYLGEPDHGQIDTESASGSRSGSDGPSTGPDEQRDGDSERQPQPDRPVHAARLFDF